VRVVARLGDGGGVEAVGGGLVAVARAAGRAELARAVADGVVGVLVEDAAREIRRLLEAVEFVVEVEAALARIEVVDDAIEVRTRIVRARGPVV